MKGKGRPQMQGGKGMLGQVQRIQAELAQARSDLAAQTVEAGAGGGAVRVVMSGAQECRAVTIAPHLLAEGDIEMLQDLVLLAVNQAIRDSQALAAKRLGPLTAGLGGLGTRS